MVPKTIFLAAAAQVRSATHSLYGVGAAPAVVFRSGASVRSRRLKPLSHPASYAKHDYSPSLPDQSLRFLHRYQLPNPDESWC